MASGEMNEAEFTAFLGQTCRNLAAFSADGSLHYICMDWRHLEELLAAGREAYGGLKNVCVWVKDNAGMGSLYRSQHELVLVFKQGGSAHRNNVQLGRFGRHRSNVWRYPGANSFARHGEEGNLLDLHATVNPVAMVADAILDCSAPRRHRARRLSRQRYDCDRRRTHRPALLRARARPRQCPRHAARDRSHVLPRGCRTQPSTCS